MIVKKDSKHLSMLKMSSSSYQTKQQTVEEEVENLLNSYATQDQYNELKAGAFTNPLPQSSRDGISNRKKTNIQQFGSLNSKRKLLKKSSNLRFRELHKPIEPIVVLCFLFVAGGIWAFLHFVVHVPNI